MQKDTYLTHNYPPPPLHANTIHLSTDHYFDQEDSNEPGSICFLFSLVLTSLSLQWVQIVSSPPGSFFVVLFK